MELLLASAVRFETTGHLPIIINCRSFSGGGGGSDHLLDHVIGCALQAAVDQPDGYFGATALHRAAGSGQPAAVALLLDNGLSITRAAAGLTSVAIPTGHTLSHPGGLQELGSRRRRRSGTLRCTGLRRRAMRRWCSS